MSVEDESRRETLKILGAIGTSCAFPFSANELYGQEVPVSPPKQVQQQAGPPERPVAVPTRATPGFFTDAEFSTVSALAELIIPRTDTPGAIDAGVPAYIDSVVGGNQQLQAILRPGLALLDAEGKFITMSETGQANQLNEWASDGGQKGQFFRAIKNLTADGYYTSRAGLMEELQYKGNAVLHHFPETTVAEH